VSIFAGTRGLLDDVPVSGVLAFEEAMLEHVRDEFPELIEEIASTGELSDELIEKLSKVITDFKGHYKANAD
ncbi:MAG: F0F1 ATP synthase subunit alpha, partial [Planctomycetes bacterium]|nr:F0F1 ATP synthase subunit alpha [Planctomycetota bacterium]